MVRKLRVLVVDDEERLAQSIARLLSARGFDARPAFSGQQALNGIESGEDVDVVVLDIKMPGMDGIETLKAIKKSAPQIEVIMLTGHASLDSGTQAMRLGAFDYLMKPCDIETLVERIREAYQVETIKRRPVLWQRNFVKDLALYSFKKLKPDDLLKEALEIFSRETGNLSVEEVYVQGADDRFIGTVNKRDFIREAEQAHPGRIFTWSEIKNNPGLLPQKSLRSLMRPVPPQTASVEEQLTVVANRMIQHNVRCMPVTKKGKVIGIVRLQDIFRFVNLETE